MRSGGRPSVALVLAAVAAAAGCAKDVVKVNPPCSLTVAASVPAVTLQRGESRQLSATGTTSGTCKAQQRFWASSNPSVAAVSGDGLVTGTGAGSATVAVTDRDEVYGTTASASVGVTVTVPVVVAIAPTAGTLDLGASRQLAATVTGAASPAVVWSSSAPGVVAVTPNGLASAGGVGVAVISARSTVAPNSVASVTITVAVSVAVSPATVSLNVGQTQRLTAVVSGAVDRQVSWTSSNPPALVVDATGLVTAVSSGTATVTATSRAAPTRSATSVVTIARPPGALLVHRWTFAQSGGAGTSFIDDVGGAHATLRNVGPNDAVAQGGRVSMTGGAYDSSDYVALPPGLLSRRSSATIEVWARTRSIKAWSRIFDFGAGPGSNLFMSWSESRAPGTDRVEWVGGGQNANRTVNGTMSPYVLDTEYQVVMTIEAGGGTGGATLVRWYRDGVLRGSFETSLTLAQLQDTNMWLGRSQYDADETADAVYNEVRIYDGAMTAAEVAARFAAGPVPN